MKVPVEGAPEDDVKTDRDSADDGSLIDGVPADVTDGPLEAGAANVPNAGAADDAASAPIARQSLGRNAFHMMSSQAVTWALAMLLSIILPRYLGPEAQGQLRLAYSLWLIAEVLVSFGTSTLLTLEIARDRAKGLKMVGPVIALRAGGYLFGWVGVMLFAILSDSSSTAVIVIAIGGATSMIASLGAIGRAALYGLEHMSYPSLADTLTRLFQVVLVLGLLLTFGGKVLIIAGAGVATVALNAVIMIKFLRRFGGLELWGGWHEVRPLIRKGRSLLIGEAALIVYLQIDSVVISLLVDERQLGLYAAADGLFASLLFVPMILMTTLFPVMGRLHVEDPGRLKGLIGQAFGSLLLVGVPIGLGTLAIGPEFAPLLYGEKFRDSGPVLAVLGIVIVLVYETILLGRYAIATGRQRLWNVLMILGIVLTIPLDLVFVPWTQDRYGNGAIGGAMSYVVTESMMMVIGLVYLAPGMFDAHAVRRVAKIVGSGVLMLAAVWPLRDQFLAIPIAVGIVVYVGLIAATSALDSTERDAIRRISNRVLPGGVMPSTDARRRQR